MSTDKDLIEKIYNDLLSMKIELDISNVPTPAYIQSKIIDCSDQQRKVEKYFLQIKRSTTLLEKRFRIKKVEIEVKKRDILTNNSQAKKIPTVKEREAYADGLLEDNISELLDLENDMNEHKSLLDSINLVLRNLKGTNSDIKSLVRIMEQQINRLNVGTHEDPEVSDLARGLEDLDSLEDEIDLDDADSNDYTPVYEDKISPTPVEDESKIVIDIYDDASVDSIMDTPNDILPEITEDDKSELSDNLNSIIDLDDEIALDEEESLEVENLGDGPYLSEDTKEVVSETLIDDIGGLPDLDAFLGGDDSDSILGKNTDSEEVSEAPRDRERLTSLDVSIPDEPDSVEIDVDDIMSGLDDMEEYSDSTDVSLGEKKEYSEDISVALDTEDPDVDISIEDDILVEVSSGTMDIDMDSDIIIDTEDEGITIDIDEEDSDPYGLGDPVPGSLASILREPEDLDEEGSENEEEKEEENTVVDDTPSIKDYDEDSGIDIDGLLDSI